MFQVLLVDQSDRFVFKPMLYELLSGGTAVSSVKCLQVYIVYRSFHMTSFFDCWTLIWLPEVDVWEIAPYFTELLKNTSVQFVKDSVKLLRPSDHFRREPRGSSTGGVVHLQSGTVIEYDWYDDIKCLRIAIAVMFNAIFLRFLILYPAIFTFIVSLF
jgi:NADH:ubiquinone reductase (non-electrogenic)